MTIHESKFTELEGLDRIALAVHSMKCIFREISKDDCGLDGEIEILKRKEPGPGYETTGGIVKVQAKSGSSYVKSNTETSFRTPVDKPHLEQWYNSTFPVVFIVYHPEDRQLYWKEIKSYVKKTPRVWQAPHYIEFDKTTDVFAGNAYPGLCDAAQTSPERISLTVSERLYSNLFRVSKAPKRLYHAPTKFANTDDLRSQHVGPLPPMLIYDQRLYSFENPRDHGAILAPYCDPHEVEPMHSWEWSESSEHRNDYVYLLNQLFGKHLHRCGLRYNKDYKRNYFPREDDESTEFKRHWRNVRTQRDAPARIVAKLYQYGKDTFWRHFAFTFNFERINSIWYLRLSPKYFFTSDGVNPFDSSKVGSYTTRIKAKEFNYQVLNHLLFLADILSVGQPAIDISLGPKRVMSIEKSPMSFVVPFGIPDDPAVLDEPTDDVQMNFTAPDFFPSPADDEDEDEQ